ncbi:MAG: nucleotidyl transferase AbiEii/AbiGii toxin family protein [Planctomycetaceae bacterium]|jgi:hypothetical protein|nr:nucleotidyl transferase AbiEii/AbiGii toxin family protein [Planctomycetaceae bacterium]
MNLHDNTKLFTDILLTTAQHFSISSVYIEKDYWITHVLKQLSQSHHASKVVFKGGTSLSKAYRLTNRFSEDIDVSVIDADSFSGNQLKKLIRQVVKEMTAGLEETVINGTTSKGSHFYKAVYIYPNIATKIAKTAVSSGQLLIEINTYAKPYPYKTKEITNFIYDFLKQTNNGNLIEQYHLQPFPLNVLDKCRTMIEKIISLIRFSFAENPVVELSAKIRHFYDLYYLANDPECSEYLQSALFQKDLSELLIHDQSAFDIPQGWRNKKITDSPLATDFSKFWTHLRKIYRNELETLAFAEIPNEKKVAETFESIIRSWL